MNKTEMMELFDKYRDEWFSTNFAIESKIENPRNRLYLVHLLIRLSELFPDKKFLVATVGEDRLYLNLELEDFLPVATEELIREFSCCRMYFLDEGRYGSFVVHL